MQQSRNSLDTAMHSVTQPKFSDVSLLDTRHQTRNRICARTASCSRPDRYIFSTPLDCRLQTATCVLSTAFCDQGKMVQSAVATMIVAKLKAAISQAPQT